MNQFLITIIDATEVQVRNATPNNPSPDHLYPNDNTDLIFQILIYNRNNNIDGDYYLMKQDYRILSSWNSFKAIQLTSNLPINSEFIDNDYSIQNRTKSENILRDFVVQYPEFSSVARTTIDYNADEFNWISLFGNDDIRNIQINCYWVDNKGIRRPIVLRYNETIQIKLLFRKKEN